MREQLQTYEYWESSDGSSGVFAPASHVQEHLDHGAVRSHIVTAATYEEAQTILYLRMIIDRRLVHHCL